MKHPSKKLTSADWQQIRTAYTLGIGLREIARKMEIPEGTVLARANREQWTRQIESARAAFSPIEKSLTVPEAVTGILEDHSRDTRANLSTAALRLSGKAMDADLSEAGDVLQVGKLASLVHGWSDAPKARSLDLSSIVVTDEGVVTINQQFNS